MKICIQIALKTMAKQEKRIENKEKLIFLFNLREQQEYNFLEQKQNTVTKHTLRLRAQSPDYSIKKIRFDYSCSACSQGKLIIKPSPSKIAIESPSFLERCKGIFVNLYTHHVDHSCILWY